MPPELAPLVEALRCAARPPGPHARCRRRRFTADAARTSCAPPSRPSARRPKSPWARVTTQAERGARPARHVGAVATAPPFRADQLLTLARLEAASRACAEGPGRRNCKRIRGAVAARVAARIPRRALRLARKQELSLEATRHPPGCRPTRCCWGCWFATCRTTRWRCSPRRRAGTPGGGSRRARRAVARRRRWAQACRPMPWPVWGSVSFGCRAATCRASGLGCVHRSALGRCVRRHHRCSTVRATWRPGGDRALGPRYKLTKSAGMRMPTSFSAVVIPMALRGRRGAGLPRPMARRVWRWPGRRAGDVGRCCTSPAWCRCSSGPPTGRSALSAAPSCCTPSCGAGVSAAARGGADPLAGRAAVRRRARSPRCSAGATASGSHGDLRASSVARLRQWDTGAPARSPGGTRARSAQASAQAAGNRSCWPRHPTNAEGTCP